MEANINKAYYEIQSDIANWHVLGEIKQGQKIQIDDVNLQLGIGRVSITAGTHGSLGQALSRTAAQFFKNAVADVNGTLQWLESFQQKTERDITLISELIPNINNTKLIKTLAAMESLRDHIAAARFGIENLQMTYSGRPTIEGNHAMDQLAHSQANSTKLLAKIDRQLDEIIRHTYHVEVVMSTPEKEKKINEIIQGRDSINVEMGTLEDRNDAEVDMPNVVIQELPRLKQFQFNGQLSYFLGAGQSNQHVEFYKRTVENLNSTNVAAVLLILCGQASIGNNISQCYFKAIEELGPINPLSSGLQCSIETKEDEVIVTLKARVKFIVQGDDIQIERGQMITKREIIIPKSSLKALNQLDYSQIKDLDEPLPGVKVIDFFSPMIPTEALAIRLEKTI